MVLPVLDMSNMNEEYKYKLPDVVANEKIQAVLNLLDNKIGSMFVYFEEKRTLILDPKI